MTPSVDEMYSDLRRADAAGDTQLAQHIATQIKAQQSAPPPQHQSAIDWAADWFKRNGRSVATTAGAVAGGLAAIPADVATAGLGAIPAEMAGTGLGAGIGGQIYDMGAKWLAPKRTLSDLVTGNGSPPSNSGTPLSHAVEDVSTGALAVPAARMVGPAVGAVAKPAAKLLAKALGATSGAGEAAVTQAVQAGRAGGAPQTAFKANMRGEVPQDSVLPVAKKAVSDMYAQRAATYQENIKPISNDPTVLPFAKITQAVKDVADRGTYKGQNIDPKATDVWKEINGQIQNWNSLNPMEYHTPEGIDALKQSIGSIRQATQVGTPERNVAQSVYDAVKGVITDQAPAYANVMKDYEEASSHLKDMQDALSQKNSVQAETSLRKLQSVLKDNAPQTRMALAAELDKNANGELLPALAGQALNPVLPSGSLGRLGAGAEMLTGLATHDLRTLGALPLTSPRLVGEGANLIGRGMRRAASVAPANIDPQLAQLINALAQARMNEGQSR